MRHKLCRSKRAVAEWNHLICLLIVHHVSEAKEDVDKANPMDFEIIPLSSGFAVGLEFFVALLKVIGGD
jgi:hypothetical protein